MRTLQLIDSLHAGGAERVLVDVSNLLSERGHNVTVLTILEKGELAGELASSISLIEMNRRFKFSIIKALFLMRIVNRHDIVHVHMRHVLHYLWFCTLFSRCRARIIFHDHFGDIEIDRSVPYYLSLVRDRILYIGVSNQLCAWAREEVNIPARNIFFLGNIVVMGSSRKDYIDPVSTGHSKKIIVVSNFKRTKNIEFVLQVTAAVRDQIDIHVDIFGKELDPVYRKELETLRNELGIRESVSFVLNETNVRSRLREYDLALHTAKSETGPLVLIEYLATRLPFVAYSTGEVYRQLKDEFPDMFVNSFSIGVWKERVLELLCRDWHSWQMRMDSIFSSLYSQEAYSKRLLSIYQRGLQGAND